MENAHLRLGLLEYVRITEKTSTRIRLRVDRYMGKIGKRIFSASSATTRMADSPFLGDSFASWSRSAITNMESARSI